MGCSLARWSVLVETWLVLVDTWLALVEAWLALSEWCLHAQAETLPLRCHGATMAHTIAGMYCFRFVVHGGKQGNWICAMELIARSQYDSLAQLLDGDNLFSLRLLEKRLGFDAMSVGSVHQPWSCHLVATH